MIATQLSSLSAIYRSLDILHSNGYCPNRALWTQHVYRFAIFKSVLFHARCCRLRAEKQATLIILLFKLLHLDVSSKYGSSRQAALSYERELFQMVPV